MAILDTFFLLFESDASKLDKGLDDSRRKAKDATEEIKKTDDAAYKLGESIGSALRQLGGVVAGYLAVRTLADNFWQAVTAADALDETAGRLGVSIEMLSAYGDAVVLAGGSLQGFTSSVEALNANLAALEVTGKSRASPFLKELGIDLESAANKGKNAVDLLPKIAAGLEKMSTQEGAALAKKLGLDSGTIMLLQQGERELDDLLRRQRELGVVTKEHGEVAAAFNDQLDNTRHAFRSMWLDISLSVLPALTWVVKKFEELATWARTNQHFLVGLMIAIGAAVAVFAIPPLLAMAAAAIAAMAPFLLMIGVIAAIGGAFALLYDDVMNFREGNDSLIGQMLERYPEMSAALEAVGGTFEWLMGVVESVLAIIGAAWRLAWEGLWMVAQATGQLVAGVFGFWIDGARGAAQGLGVVADAVSAVGSLFTSVGRLVAGIFDYWIDRIGAFLERFGGVAGLLRSIGGAISGGLDAARGAMGVGRPAGPRQSEPGAGGEMGAYGIPGLAQGKAALATATATPLASQTSNSVTTRSSNRSTTVQVDQVNVQTQATDAAGISKSIGDSLGAQMRQAAANYDDGVVA